MIVLDTHIWVWWIDGSSRLTAKQLEILKENEAAGLGVSIISLWEVAKLVERNRLVLSCPVEEWILMALAYPGVVLLDLTPDIAIRSTQLPGQFHKDPADQMIVATAMALNCPLMTVDEQILNYHHVKLVKR
jgi:PIN domain nuclease of toxin-antitoxin system